MLKAIFISFVFFGAALPLFAQEKEKDPGKKVIEMNVDMPDETQETDILDKGQWQFETAYLHNIYKEGKHSSVGQGLLRYGVSKRLELRLLVEAGSQLQRYIEETVQSTFPFAASAKIVLLKDYKNLPDITLVSFLHIPVTLKKDDKKGYWSPVFLLAFQNKLGEKWKLEYNTGIQQEAYSTEWAWVVNTALHYQLTDQLEFFAEYFAQFKSADSPQHNSGGGIAYQVNNYLEVFAMAGGTINSEPSNHFYNAGLAVRVP